MDASFVKLLVVPLITIKSDGQRKGGKIQGRIKITAFQIHGTTKD